MQQADGHWVFELEADATIPAEYVLLRHYLGEPVDAELEAKIAVYLRRIQGEHGGWPLFHDGAFDMSASVKAYFALKMIGDVRRRAAHEPRPRGDPRARRRGRAQCLHPAHAGAVRHHPLARGAGDAGRDHAAAALVSVPSRQDFVLGRTVIVPLLVLLALKPKARNPKGVGIDELFLEPPQTIGPAPKAPQQKASWFWFFRGVDDVLRAIEPMFPKRAARSAPSTSAVAFVTERLNGEDGLGAIFPAMANSVMMFDALGYPQDHPHARDRAQSIDKLLVVHEHEAYCQPCVSPVWDTGARLSRPARSRRRARRRAGRARASNGWCRCRCSTCEGDWAARRPDVRPGGWAFQYANPHYPDVDDTAVVVMAMDRAQA